MRRLLRTFNKIIKIICAAYLTIFSIGFILPTHIRENAISVYDAFSNAENTPMVSLKLLKILVMIKLG